MLSDNHALIRVCHRRLPLWLAAAGASLLLAACAAPSRDISRIPTQTDAVSSQDGTFTQPVKWSKTQPGCTGQCPEIRVDSLVFPGKPDLTELVDHLLANMARMGESANLSHDDIEDFTEYYWQTAGPHDEVDFNARTRYRNRHLTAIELNIGRYYTGAAHGMTATQFLNWDNERERVIELDDVLVAGAYSKYLQALEAAHQAWMKKRPEVQEDAATWARMWPFQPSRNFAFTDSGLVVKYNSYDIAPYSSGQPELHIPYNELQGILRSEYLPAAKG